MFLLGLVFRKCLVGVMAGTVCLVAMAGLTFLVPKTCSAAIVDVSGIEVPPVSGPVCANCNGAGCDQCQPQSPDPDPEPEPDPTPPPTANPTPPPTPKPVPPPVPPPPPPPVVDPVQQQLDRDKSALLSEIRIPAVPSQSDLPAGSDDILLNENTVMGVGPMPAGISQPGGLTSDEWKLAGEAQRELDALHGKWPLSAAEIARYDKAEVQRNTLWRKAVSLPGLTGEERQRLRLEFHVRGLRAGEPAPPTVTPSNIEQWQKIPPLPEYKEPPTSAPVPTPVNPVTALVLKHVLVNQPTAGVEYMGAQIAETLGDSPFGNIVSAAKIFVGYKDSGQAGARAAGGDFLVGFISYPQAQFAVDGGRTYGNVVYQAMNKFMTDAMKSVGADFDMEQFMSNLKRTSDSDTQATMEWIGYDTK